MSEKPPVSHRVNISEADRQTSSSAEARRQTNRPGTDSVYPQQQHYGPASQMPHPSTEDRRLPPITQTSSTPTNPIQQSGPRGLGVRNILNPAEPEVEESQRRYASTENVDSPVRSIGFSPSGSPGLPHAEGYRSTGMPSPYQEVLDARQDARKILTPRSPRAASFTGRGVTVSNPSSLSARPRAYQADILGIETPNMPTGVPTGSYFIPPIATSDNLRKRASMSAIDTRAPQTKSTSPTPSLTPSHGSQTAATTRAPHSQGAVPASYFPGQSLGHVMQGGPQVAEGPLTSERNFPLLAGAQTNTKLYSFTAEDGSQFMVPVDVQAASKVADEKRARNAGASARFRERRKAREKEADTAIKKLEQQARDLERRNKELEDQVNHYKEDRDRFRDIVYRTPGISHLATQVTPSPGNLTTRQPRDFPSSQQWEEMPTDLDELSRPSQRRRTDKAIDLHPHPFQSTGPHFPAVQLPGYGPAPSRSDTLPRMRDEGVTSQISGDPSALSHLASTQSSSRPPYSPYQTRDYDRRWPAGPSCPPDRK